MRCHEIKPIIVQLDQWHWDSEQSSSRPISGNSLSDRTLIENLKNYVENGVFLLEDEEEGESDLKSITIRVAEQMVSSGIIETFDIENVSNVFLLMKGSAPKEPISQTTEEHKPSDEKTRTHSKLIDIQKLICNDDINPALNKHGTETALLMVANATFVVKPSLSFVRRKTPVCFPQTLDCECPVRFVLILLAPSAQQNYIEMGSSLWTLISDEEFRAPAFDAKTKEELIRAIKNVYASKQTKDTDTIYEEEEHSNLLSSNFDQQYSSLNPLLKTNRLWGGLTNDIARRFPQYKSDILDGLNRQVLAASIFLYFGVLSTAITFGGLLSSKTDNLMGISETLLSTSLVGIVFHLISSQPLIIVGGTGPLLLFDEALFQLCQLYEFDFLTVRIYIGLWLGIFAVTIAAFDGCVYLRLLTRFTQELFASLISLIFMMEAVFKVIDVFKTYPISLESNDTASLSETVFDEAETEKLFTQTSTINVQKLYEANTALFCAILSVGTFVLAYCLRTFRNSHFLGRSIRRALGDFGVPISISAFVYLSYLVPQIYTEKLIVPEGLSPTNPTARSWIIPFNAIPIWLPFVCAIAALLVYVLIGLETLISELLLDQRGMKKGSGFHVDIVIICLLNVVCGFLGMPWQSGATIRSVTHVSAVTTLPEQSVESGEPPQLIVKEQRVSGLIISVSVGLSVVMAPILRLIPVSVLYGVFFYMGIVSISGVQFLHRIRLLFTPTKYHGDEVYVQRVPTWKMHIFTSVQVLALCVLWIVKSSRFSLALPFVLLLMIPLNQKISTYFTATEMAALDGNLPEIDVKDEPDFYEQSHLPM